MLYLPCSKWLDTTARTPPCISHFNLAPDHVMRFTWSNTLKHYQINAIRRNTSLLNYVWCAILCPNLMQKGRPSFGTSWRWERRSRGGRNGPCNINSLTDVGQVRVTLLIRPVGCNETRHNSVTVKNIWTSPLKSGCSCVPLLVEMWTHLRSRLTGCGLPSAQET